MVNGGRDTKQHVQREPSLSAVAGKQSNTSQEPPLVGGGRETRAAGAPVVGGVQDTGQSEQHVLHGLPAMPVQGRPVRRPPRVVARDEHLGIRAQQPHIDDLHTHLHGFRSAAHTVVVAPLRAD